ncbi:DKNYY family protein [Atlantibacter subterraneus]|uniref:DKNYY family protein n=1 Tax=Atlantibacter subterraneus TaxID=255519 RepID=UPI00289FA463|nr:DKNYY family protein [Atlantibacter subterranea]
MKYFRLLCLILLPLGLTSAWGCRMDPTPHYAYQKQGKGAVYIWDDEYSEEMAAPLSYLPDINFSRLRRLPDLAKTPDKQPSEWYPDIPLTELNTDFIVEGENTTRSYFSYHSDGRHVLWAGKLVRNPPGAPPVHAATFHVFGRFAADKDSLYFDGVRTEANEGVDFATLNEINAGASWHNGYEPEQATVLRDKHYLYLRGHRVENPDSYTITAQKSWDQRGKFTPFYPCINSPYGPWDTLAHTADRMIINGHVLDADVESFSVIRWLPGTLFIYRDKNGVKRFSLREQNAELPRHALDRKDCSAPFNMLENKVTWRKAWNGNSCETEIIPGLDPEQFHLLNGQVAQYQDRLYSVKRTVFGETYLDMITLDDPQVIIDKRFNADKQHGYLLTTSGELVVFNSDGPLVLLDKEVPREREAHTEDGQYRPNWFARDNRYVYVFDGMQLYRYATVWPLYAHIEGQHYQSGYGSALSKTGGSLVTLEGRYFHDVFEPNKNGK